MSFKYSFENDIKSKHWTEQVYDTALTYLVSEYIIKKVLQHDSGGGNDVCYLTNRGNLIYLRYSKMGTIQCRKFSCNDNEILDRKVIINVIDHGFKSIQSGKLIKEITEYIKLIKNILFRNYS